MCEGLTLGISHILTNAPYFILACALFWGQRRRSARATVLPFAAFVFAHGLSDFLLTAFYSGNFWWPPLQFIIFCAGSLVLLLVVFRITFARALYSFLLLRAVYTALLYVVLNAFMMARPGEYIGFDRTPLYTLAAVLAMGAVFPLLWRYFRGRLRAAFSQLDEKTIRQLCIPPVLFFLLDQCYSAIRDTLEHKSFQTAAIFILILCTGIVTYYVNLRMAMESGEQARLQSEMKNQLALQAQHYGHLTESVERARAARHDLRHHLSVISDYAGKGDAAGLRAYLDEYIGGIPDEPLTPYCANHAVNAVAQHYLAMAKQAGAQLDIRLRLPQDAGIPDSDLCIVFGDVFENAAQSCARQEDARRFIRARCETAGGRLVFTADNSVSGSEGEGIGLRSVRAVAKKYNGSAEFAREGDTYKTSVILLNPDV
jgi:hypothetical protein